MGVWDTSVGVSVGSGVVAIPPKLRMLWWSWSWTKQHFPLPQTASLLLQKWMVGKRDSFPFWSPKSQFCRGEVGAVCFGETYDVIDLDVWTLYFWDPYLFFFAKTDFRTELVRGLQRKMRKFVVFLYWLIFIFLKFEANWLGSGWGIFEIWRFECNTSTRCLF